MNMRVGKVTSVYASSGKVKVVYEDENSSSLQLPMITMNQEYSMPEVGDYVVTMHMENGSSKGFVLGTYYSGVNEPKASTGYRKDFTSSAYATCTGGRYTLKASTINLKGSVASVSLGSNATMSGTKVTLASAAESENEDGDMEADVYVKISDTDIEAKAAEGVKITADAGAFEVTANGEAAKFTLDTNTEFEAETVSIKVQDMTIEADNVSINADNITLTCSYGTITVEQIMKRLEAIENLVGLPHTA